MNIRTLALFSAVAFAGCGSDNSNPDGNTGGNDNGCEPNCGSEAFEATIQANVGWTTGDFTLNGRTLDECTDASTCPISVEQADLYEVDFENTHGFVTKLVDVNDEGEFAIAWDEPGDWSFKASGLYRDQWGQEQEIDVDEQDFDGDGDDERTIGGTTFRCGAAVFDQSSFEATCTDAAGEELTETGWFDGETGGYYLRTYASDGHTVEYDLELIEAYEE